MPIIEYIEDWFSVGQWGMPIIEYIPDWFSVGQWGMPIIEYIPDWFSVGQWGMPIIEYMRDWFSVGQWGMHVDGGNIFFDLQREETLVESHGGCPSGDDVPVKLYDVIMEMPIANNMIHANYNIHYHI